MCNIFRTNSKLPIKVGGLGVGIIRGTQEKLPKLSGVNLSPTAILTGSIGTAAEMLSTTPGAWNHLWVTHGHDCWLILADRRDNGWGCQLEHLYVAFLAAGLLHKMVTGFQEQVCR